jgi:hypothetical protein
MDDQRPIFLFFQAYLQSICLFKSDLKRVELAVSLAL